MSRNIIILQGSKLDIQVHQNDVTATDVDFIIKNDSTNAVETIHADYSNAIAQVEITGLNTGVAGTYSYQINENTPTGIVKYGTSVYEQCEFGKVYIVESLDGTVS